jgi:hypothetical protein
VLAWSLSKSLHTSVRPDGGLSGRRRPIDDHARCGWKLERVLSDNGNEFKADFNTNLRRLDARHTRIRAGRTNGRIPADIRDPAHKMRPRA